VYAELGSGGMATVFLALDLALDRKVAIKVMSPSLMTTPGAIERFRREARTAAALSHPHIVPIYAIGDDPSLAYYVMKFIEGRGLDSVLREEGAQSPAFVQAILSYVGAALQHAHQSGVVHRDVKPANIMLDRDGWTYVTDFGIAKRDDGHGLTQSGMIIGTPAYMCPEQFNGSVLTGAADQYALGCVAYEMLAGRTPYDGPSLGEVMRGHLLEPVPRVRLARPDVPEALEACVTRMLAKEPGERFADRSEAIGAIGAVSPSVESEARTTIVRLARAGDATRPSISVPQSPSPGTYRTAGAAGPRAGARASGREISDAELTVRTPTAQRMPVLAAELAARATGTRPPEPVPAKGGGWLFRGFVLLAVVAGVGFLTKRLAEAERLPWQSAPVASTPVAEPPVSPPTGGDAATTSSTPSPDGIVVAATDSTTDSTTSTAATAAPPRTPEPQPVLEAPPVTVARDSGEAGGDANEGTTRTRPQPGAAGGANRAGGQGRALRERLDAMNDRREAAGQAPLQAGVIRLGTTGPRYTLFVNGRARQVISGRDLHDVPLPAGAVQLSLRAINCVSWDTVVTVRSNQVQVIGERAPHC